MNSENRRIPEGLSLAGKFLIAMPGLQDPNFERAVLFVCTHTEDGALALVINQPHLASMNEVISPLGLEWRRSEKPVVFQGGPVASDRGFILYETSLEYPGHIRVDENLYLGTNPAILRYLLQSSDRGRFLFALGYAGWESGQLEAELRENIWLVSALDRKILFDLPIFSRWESAIHLLGIDSAPLIAPGSNSVN